MYNQHIIQNIAIIDTQDIIYLFCFIVSLVLGFIIYLKAIHTPGRLFSVFLLSVCLWIICSFLTENSLQEYARLFWTKMCMVGPIVAAPLFYVFTLYFPDNPTIKSKAKLILPFLSAIPLLILVPTKWNVVEIQTPKWGIDFVPGPLYLIYLIYLIIMLFLSGINLRRKFRSGNKTEKTQIVVLAIGILSMTSISATFSLILPLLGDIKFHYFSPISTLLIMLATYYAISNHRLFGIKIVIGKAVYLLLLIAVTFAMFQAYHIIQQKYLSSPYQPAATAVGFIVFALIVFALFTVNKRLKNTVNYFIINRKYNPEKETQDLALSLGTALTSAEVKTAVLKTINSTVVPARSDILLEGDKGDLAKKLSRLNLANFAIEEELTEKSNEKIRQLKQLLITEKIKAVFPMRIDQKAVGHILLSKKRDDSAYTQEELEYLNSITAITAVAIDRIGFYEKSKETAILRAERKKEQEVVDVMGHELRTPATIAKMAIQQAIYEISTKESGQVNKKNLKDTLKLALDGIDRQYQLAQKYITSARIAKGAFVLNKSTLDLLSLSRQIAKEFASAANTKNISLKVADTSNLKTFPQVEADPQAIHQVLSNLVENALKYSKPGSKVAIKLDVNNKYISASVSDSGHGIPKEEIAKLGGRFYRVKSAPQQIPGTGLGLYIVFQIIREHNGKIRIKSRVGQGSTFTFMLPR